MGNETHTSTQDKGNLPQYAQTVIIGGINWMLYCMAPDAGRSSRCCAAGKKRADLWSTWHAAELS